MNEIDVGGLRVAFEREGAGAPLVLLHGILQDSRAWRPQIASLSGDFMVLAWDTPGCGRSSDPPDTFSLPDYADFLAETLKGVGIGPAHILGLSWGGGLALEFYRRHPGSVTSLVLTGAYAGWSGSLPAEVVEQRLQQALREADLPPDQFVSGWIPGLLTDLAPKALREETVAMMSDFHPAGYRTMARAFAAADLRESLAQVGVPTLLLWGKDDRRSPLSVADHLHEKIPHSRLVVLPGAGHLSNIEVPKAFNREVGNFLRTVEI